MSGEVSFRFGRLFSRPWACVLKEAGRTAGESLFHGDDIETIGEILYFAVKKGGSPMEPSNDEKPIQGLGMDETRDKRGRASPNRAHGGRLGVFPEPIRKRNASELYFVFK